MPSNIANSQLATMDARLAAIEASLEAIPQLLQTSISLVNSSLAIAFNKKLAICFEQFHREQPYIGGGNFSLDPMVTLANQGGLSSIFTGDGEFRYLETPRHPCREQFDGGGYTS